MLGVHPMRAWQPDARVASPLDEARAVVRRAAAPPAVADILPLDSLCDSASCSRRLASAHTTSCTACATRRWARSSA